MSDYITPEQLDLLLRMEDGDNFEEPLPIIIAEVSGDHLRKCQQSDMLPRVTLQDEVQVICVPYNEVA